MLQILIWMGCTLFLLLGLQFWNVASLTDKISDSLKLLNQFGSLFSLAAAIIFFFLANNQAERLNSEFGGNDSYQGSLDISERSTELLTPEQRRKYNIDR